MRAFVTGGAGFIGSNLVSRLMAGGHSVTVYDNLTSGKREHLKAHLRKNKFKLIVADLLDFNRLKKSIRGSDIVFHLASNPDIAKSMKQTDLDLKQGIIATFNVIEAMRLNGIKKIVYVSGSGIYGDVGKTYTPEDFGPLEPISMYGASKLSAEALISAFANMFDMKAWVFRLANVIGPVQTHGVIYDFIRKLRQNPGELLILGDGTQSKSYVHVTDVLDAVMFCLKNTNRTVNVYNVSTPDFATVTRIAREVAGAMGLKGVKFSYTGGSRGWKGDVPVVRIDTKYINRLGWKPKLSGIQAIRRAIAENLCR